MRILQGNELHAKAKVQPLAERHLSTHSLRTSSNEKILFAFLLLLGFNAAAFADKQSVSTDVVIQVNGDKAEFKRALILASNMREAMTKARFEIAVYGENVKLLNAFSDAIPLIQKVQNEGIQIIACGRSLKSEKAAPGDLAQGIKVVPFGAVHIVNRQKQGWQYIKP